MVTLLILTILAALLVVAMAAPAPKIKGITTIRWGAGGVAGGSGGLAAALVKKVTHQTLGGEPTRIEDTNGFVAVLVLLVDGDELTFQCVDDSAIVWPQKGDVIQCTVPGWLTGKGFFVTDNNADLERKREGERNVKCEYHVGMDPLT